MNVQRPITTTRGDGWVWPLSDDVSFDQIMPYAQTVPEIVEKFCLATRRRTVLQAGGHCGLYPRFLAEKFGQVVTLEPDFQSFYCLTLNADMSNVIKINAALGREPGSCQLDRAAQNTGTTRMSSQVQDGQVIPRMTIDGLNLRCVDLIWLDVEGYEMFALAGAEQTIKRWKPLILFEDNGLSQTYGIPRDDPRAWLEQTFDYVTVDRVGDDQVMAPR